MDRLIENMSRSLAKQQSRRGFLGSAGRFMIGAGVAGMGLSAVAAPAAAQGVGGHPVKPNDPPFTCNPYGLVCSSNYALGEPCCDSGAVQCCPNPNLQCAGLYCDRCCDPYGNCYFGNCYCSYRAQC